MNGHEKPIGYTFGVIWHTVSLRTWRATNGVDPFRGFRLNLAIKHSLDGITVTQASVSGCDLLPGTSLDSARGLGVEIADKFVSL